MAKWNQHGSYHEPLYANDMWGGVVLKNFADTLTRNRDFDHLTHLKMYIFVMNFQKNKGVKFFKNYLMGVVN